MSRMRLSIRVWDAPTRLFHWALVLLVAAAYITQALDFMDLHFLCGYAILTLLLFRLVWGLVGSDTARFARFIASPRQALLHLRHFRRREPDNQIGHNAAGGWMVLAMLGLLAVQASTGLFANDDIAHEGPLAQYVGKHISNRFSYLHSANWNLILAAVGLHIVAVFAYLFLKKQNLIRPMLTGKKRLPAATRPPHMASPWLALLIFALAAGAVSTMVILALRGPGLPV
jgi:cytochrome b